MLVSRSFVFLTVLQVLVLHSEVDGWRRRRRRRRRVCYPRNCYMSSWSSWSRCSATCGSSGIKRRTRRIISYAYCGGRCYSTSQTARCPYSCCPSHCSYSWSSWSACSATCRYGTRSRRTYVYRNPSCGGRACPSSPQTQTCGNGRCCPVSCLVGSWGSWGGCNAACERTGRRTRTRPITRRATCGGTGCPSTTDSKTCSGPCCRRDCVLTSWSAWSRCNSASCARNSGTQSRTRRITTAASCGGSCSSLSQTQRCTPIPITCLMSSWGRWQPCVPTNGRCGRGSQKRVRTVVRSNYCSPGCPATQEYRSCMHSCCPVDCRVNSWQAWNACSSTCGRGTKIRKRTVATSPSCGGQACPSLTQTTFCDRYDNADCIMGAWGRWSVCDNGCGQGRARRTRGIIKKEVCRGRKCGALEEFRACTDYRNNRDCKVGPWTAWGKCDQTCTVGTKQRTRVVTVSQQCRGNKCPALKESTQCGSPNNGCQHKCTNGVCSCNPGYNLVGGKQCVAKDCGKLSLSYCAPGTQLGTTCRHATVSCPHKKTTFPVTCSIVCSSTYAVKGVSSVSCTAAGKWSSTAGTYCRRINDPPTQILLSGSHSVPENRPRNTLVGALSSLDPNKQDSHTYTLRSGGGGKFVIRGDKLLTSHIFDYETMDKRYDLTIRSTDNGNPRFSVDKVITVLLTDVNEKPTGIQLSNSQVPENSDADAVVGFLSTGDQDRNQQYSYSMIDAAGGRFKIDGNAVKVALKNKRCLDNGGAFCALDYERNRSLAIVVRSTDDGNPALSIDVTLNIALTDVNDQPRGLGLSSNSVRENATKGHVIGRFSAQDEDRGQILRYSLTDDDQGRFAVTASGELYKVRTTDYETNKTHVISAAVEDSGTPRKRMERQFVIEVLDVNEPPIDIHLNDRNDQRKFPLDQAQINETVPRGTVVGTLQASDNDAAQNLNFTLDNDALGRFSLTRVSCTHPGKTVCNASLLVSGDINYELSQVLEIAVRVTDQHGLFKVRPFNISVVDVNERPSNVTISGGLQASVFENSPGAFVGGLVTTDEDENQRHSYTLLTNTAVFEIRGNKLYLRSNKSLNYERRNQYVIIVTSTDNGSPPLTFSSRRLLIQVRDRNESPTRITLSNYDILENMPAGTIIGNLTVEDPDNLWKFTSRQTHVCRLSGSAQGKFRVVSRNGRNSLVQVASGLDYEKSVSHNISVVCADTHGLSLERSFVVRVIDVNEAPTKVILSKTTVSENLSPVTIGRLSTQDPDNKRDSNTQSFQYSLASVKPGSSPFTVVGDALKTTRSLNYETARSWTVVVRAEDNGTPPLYRDESIVVDVVDKNDRPSAIQLSNVRVDENSRRDTVVGNLATSDEDVGQKHTYTMIDDADGRFKVRDSSVLIAPDNTDCLQYGGSFCALNYELQPSHNITIRATDNGSPVTSYDQTFVIFLADVNDQPRDLRLSHDQVRENASIGTVVGSFSAREEDIGQALRFSLIDDDGGRFTVNSKGELVTAKKLDHESAWSHVILAEVVDNGFQPMKLQRNFTIEVLNVNEAPVSLGFAGVQAPSVPENTTTGSIVGTLLAQDFDAGQQLQFRLDDDSDGEFSLDSSTLQCQSITNSHIKTSCSIKLVLSKRLNYEATKSRNITVRVTDNNGLFKAQRFSVNVTDCNDAPTNITLSGGMSAVVNENAVGEFVGRLETSDEDTSQSWKYEFVDDAGGLFRIVGSKIYVSKGMSLNFEGQSIYLVHVRSTDNGSPSYDITQNFTIVVADINEQPTNITLSGHVTDENSSQGTVIANITVYDPDNSVSPRQVHSCAVIGQNSNKLIVTSGTLVNSVKLDHEGTPEINITIQCFDNGSPPLAYQADFTVQVLDVNEAPVDIILSSSMVCENQPPGAIATLSTIDADNSVFSGRQSFTYQFIPQPATEFPFVIDNDTHSLNTTRRLNYERNASWSMVVRSTDSGSPQLAVSRSFVIQVEDVNEAPTNIFLSPNMIDENPEEDTLVGTLTTVDEDFRQSHRYTLLQGASGRFKLVNNTEIRVAVSNKDCLLHGGKHCRLNYEDPAQRVFTIRMRSTDDGSPLKEHVTDLNITLRDINDQPRELSLSKHWVKENATVGTAIGYFNATDEDVTPGLSYSLAKNTHGLFEVERDGRLFVAKPLNHEVSSAVSITVNVTDSGRPQMWMAKQFTVVIQNVNEAPVNTSLTSQEGQQTFADNNATIEENSPLGSVVGTLVSLDQDAGQHLNFTLDDSSGGRFSVNSTSSCFGMNNTSIKTKCLCLLHVNGSLNFEDTPHHDIIVRVTDIFGHFHVSSFIIKVLDRNDQPTNITLQGSLSGRVKENRNDEIIGELVTSDEDSSQSHAYALRDDRGARFTLKGSRLYTSLTANLNYEAQQQFVIVVVSTDNGTPPKSVERTLTIQVEDVNESPTNITLSGLAVPENSAEGAFVANISVEDPDNLGPKGLWQSHTCHLLDTAQDRFKIDNTTNSLLVHDGELNYERGTSHDIVIECTDSAARPLTVRKSFQIEVLDINETPVQLSLSNDEVAENSEPLLVGDLNTVDPDNEVTDRQGFRYSLVHKNEEDPFIISGNQLKTNRSLDYERKSSWEVFIKTTDPGGLSLTQNFTVTVKDTNDPPTDINSTSQPLIVFENSPAGTPIAVFSAVDEDAGQTHNFFINDITASGYGNVSTAQHLASFISLETSSGRLLVTSAIDFETFTQFSVEVMTVDSGYPLYSFNKTFVLRVYDVNEPPVAVLLDHTEIPENSAQDSFVGNLSVKDPDNRHREQQHYECEVVNNVPFKVLQMKLLVADAILNFENKRDYLVKVNCSQIGNATFHISRMFFINVTDVNEPPFNLTISHDVVEENREHAQSVVGIITAKDPDGDFAETTEDSGSFSINGSSLLTTSIFDYEKKNSYNITLIAMDDGRPRLNTTRQFQIKIRDRNDQPERIFFASSGVYENATRGTIVGNFSTLDQDKEQLHEYRLLSYMDIFMINRNQLLVNESGMLDFETKPLLNVTVLTTDNGTPKRSHQEWIQVTVLDVNERPYDIYSTKTFEYHNFSLPVQENTQGSTNITFHVQDRDFNHSHSCSLIRGTEFFEIDNTTRTPVLRVRNGSVLDYENKTSVEISLLCYDDGVPPLAYNETFTITVVDVNEKPLAITLNGSSELVENVPDGQRLGVLLCRDPDRNQNHSFEVLGYFNDTFSVIKETNILTVISNKKLDYEKLDSPNVTLSINATDSGSPPLWLVANLTLTVKDLNEGANEIQLSPVDVTLNETRGPGTNISELVCNNPERWQTVKYTLFSNEDLFMIKTMNYSLTLDQGIKRGTYDELRSYLFVRSNLSYDNAPIINRLCQIKPRHNMTCRLVQQSNMTCGRTPTVNLSCDMVTECHTVKGTDGTSGTVPRFNLSCGLGGLSNSSCNLTATFVVNCDMKPRVNLTCDQNSRQQFNVSSGIITQGSNVTNFTTSSQLNRLNSTSRHFDLSCGVAPSSIASDYTERGYEILVGVTDNGHPRLSFNDTVEVKIARVDPCVPQNECSTNAECRRVDGFRYNCTCMDGFTGNGYNCTEIDDCSNSSTYCDNDTNDNETCPPCKNNASCTDAHLSFNCSCLPGFNGTRCEHNIDECGLPHFNNCTKFGQCVDGINNVTCNCYRGYTGRFCDVNIIDCFPSACGNHGTCQDHLDSYSCNCTDSRYIGTRCDRDAEECNKEKCSSNQYCVPYNISLDKGSQNEYQIQNRDICFTDRENISRLYLSKNLTEVLREANISLDRVNDSLRIILENWLLKYVQVLYVYTDSYTEDYYNLTDVAVVGNFVENPENISVSVVARIGRKAVSERGFVCSLSHFLLANNSLPKLCPRPENYSFSAYTSQDFSYTDYLCPMVNYSNYFDCVDPPPILDALSKGDPGSPLPLWAICLMAAIGGVLFVVFVAWAVHGHRSQKFNLQEAMRRRQQYDHVRLPEEDDEHYRDVMFRHHISTTMAHTGAANPIYGLDEHEDGGQMIANPLYGTVRPESPPSDHRAFANPLYESVQREPVFRAQPVTKAELNY